MTNTIVDQYVYDFQDQATYTSRARFHDKKSKVVGGATKWFLHIDVIKSYNKLVEDYVIKPNPTFYQYSLKKWVKVHQVYQ